MSKQRKNYINQGPSPTAAFDTIRNRSGDQISFLTIIDHNKLLATLLADFLTSINHLEITVINSWGPKAQLTPNSNEHYVLIDPTTAGVGGLHGVSLICEKYKNTKVILIADSLSDRSISYAREIDISGIVSTSMSAPAMRAALHLIMTGEKYFPADMPGITRREAFQRRHGLSHSDSRILSLIVRGKTNAQICSDIGASESVAKMRVNALTRRLKCQGRTNLAIRYLTEQDLEGPGQPSQRTT